MMYYTALSLIYWTASTVLLSSIIYQPSNSLGVDQESIKQSYEIFNERPLLETIAVYCTQDMQLIPRLWRHYFDKRSPAGAEKVKILSPPHSLLSSSLPAIDHHCTIHIPITSSKLTTSPSLVGAIVPRCNLVPLCLHKIKGLSIIINSYTLWWTKVLCKKS